MSFCAKCGKELPDRADYCPACGNAASENPANGTAETTPLKDAKKGSKKKVLLISIGAVVLVLAILAVILFSRPNMELGDFGEIGTVGAILKFGIPSNINDDGDWVYDDCIKVYGYTADRFIVNPEKDEYLFNVYDGRKIVQQAIADAATSRSHDILGNKTYSFKNLDITDYGWGIKIVVN